MEACVHSIRQRYQRLSTDQSALIRNPFVNFNADDLEARDFDSRFVRPPGYQQLVTNLMEIPNGLISGSRGSGKTMVLRSLSYEVRRHSTNEPRPIQFIGCYINLSRFGFDRMSHDRISSHEQQAIFSFYLGRVIFLKMISVLEDLAQDGLYSRLRDVIPQMATHLSLESNPNTTAEDLKQAISQQMLTIDRELNQPTPSLTASVSTFSVLNINQWMAVVWAGFADIKPRLFLLLDQYEILSATQQRVVNAWIKGRVEGLEFKIGVRPDGVKTTLIGNTQETLEAGHDFLFQPLDRYYMEKKAQYRIFLREVAERLMNPGGMRTGGRSKIERLLSSSSELEEAREAVPDGTAYDRRPHVRAFRNRLAIEGLSDLEIENAVSAVKVEHNPLIEKLAMLLVLRGQSLDSVRGVVEELRSGSPQSSTRYLFQKNSLALLFQLLHESRRAKQYAGFRLFADLSNGAVRNFLVLCQYAFQNFRFESPNEFPEIIAPKFQSAAAGKHAEDLLKAVTAIPKDGLLLRRFVEDLGQLFRDRHLSMTLGEPEPTYFATNSSMLSERSRQLLETAVRHSVLQRREPMMWSGMRRTPDVFVLNRGMAPRFKISWRIRGRTVIPPEILDQLLSEKTDERKKALRWLHARTNPHARLRIQDVKQGRLFE